MNSMDLLTGYVDCSEQEGVTSPDYKSFRPRTSVSLNRQYYLFIFQLCYKGRIFYNLGRGVSNKGRWRLPSENLNRFMMPMPPIQEQNRIVDYLKDKTLKIDQYISERERERELLASLKQSVIANVVTKGVNPNVRMKDSGIPWIGMIPEHWKIKRLRHFIKFVSIRGNGEKTLLSVTREQGVIERNVKSKEENHNFIPDDLSNYKLVQKGQFVINKMKSWQGSYGVSAFEGIVSPAYYVSELSFPCKRFFSLAIRSKAYIPFFAQYSKGIRVDQWDLSPIGLKSIPFIVPPIEEQQAIVDYIEAKLSKIDSCIADLQAEIDYLKEFKQRLISDVVTGQICVSNHYKKVSTDKRKTQL